MPGWSPLYSCLLCCCVNRSSQRTLVDDKNVILQSNYRLSDTHDDSLVVFGSVVELDAGSRVTGDASFITDKLNITGEVDGDLNVLGGSLTVAEGAQIGGDVNATGTTVTFGGNVNGDLLISAENIILLPSAQISGTIDACAPNVIDQRVGVSQTTCTDDGFNPFAALIAVRETAMGSTTFGARLDSAITILVGVVCTILLTGASALVVTLFPRQISHIEEAVRARPRRLGSIGVATYALTLGLALVLIVVLANLPPLGLLLVPFYLILTILLLILSFAGLITLALMLGDWLARRISKLHTPPLIAAMIGSVLLSAGLALISLLPFGFAISFLLLGVISSVGLGGALATRIGTRSVQRAYFVQG